MTIISAVLGEHYIAIASDSFRTEPGKGRKHFNILDSQLPKIVSVPRFLGAISWAGYSGMGDDLLPWFEKLAKQAYRQKTAEKFADYLGKQLTNNFDDQVKKVPGIAVHFVAYEPLGSGGALVPEIFYIHTFNGDYKVKPGLRVRCQRLSYFTVSGETCEPTPEHRQEEFRMKVLARIRQCPLVYSNPNPKLFAPLAL
ncbi:hypothetical protein KBI23_16975 [bacterium]|nr:hypothetical protein [bacterium]MBP9806836.1 hypothetical protein [bacterium]